MEFRGGKPAEDCVCRRTSCHCGRCREVDAGGHETGTCRAVLNIFELCRCFVNTRPIDMAEMAAIHDGRCRVTTRRRADDAPVEMMPVGIAASTALAAIRARDRLDRLRERILAARFRAHCSADREKGLPRSSREPLRIGRLVE